MERFFSLKLDSLFRVLLGSLSLKLHILSKVSVFSNIFQHFLPVKGAILFPRIHTKCVKVPRIKYSENNEVISRKYFFRRMRLLLTKGLIDTPAFKRMNYCVSVSPVLTKRRLSTRLFFKTRQFFAQYFN